MIHDTGSNAAVAMKNRMSTSSVEGFGKKNYNGLPSSIELMQDPEHIAFA